MPEVPSTCCFPCSLSFVDTRPEWSISPEDSPPWEQNRSAALGPYDPTCQPILDNGLAIPAARSGIARGTQWHGAGIPQSFSKVVSGSPTMHLTRIPENGCYRNNLRRRFMPAPSLLDRPAAGSASGDAEGRPLHQHQRHVFEKLTSPNPTRLSPQTPWFSYILPTTKGWLVGGEPSTASKADVQSLLHPPLSHVC